MTSSLTVQQNPPSSRQVLAPPVACTVSEGDAKRQLKRARVVTPYLLATARTPVELTLTFAAGADRAAVAAFAETERECCSFFEEISDATLPDGRMVLHYAGAADGSHELALAEVARIFDGSDDHAEPATDASEAAPRRGPAKKTAGLLAAAGVACSACLIPGLAVGGAGVFAGTVISGERLLLAAGAAGLLAFAAYKVLARRRNRGSEGASGGCGC